MKSRQNVLLYGDDVSIAAATSQVFSGAGCGIDVVSTNRKMARLPGVRRFFRAENAEATAGLCLQLTGEKKYLFRVPVNDNALALILSSSMTLEEKLRILPVDSPESIRHLCSKIKLADIFRGSSIRTPRFIVATHDQIDFSSLSHLGNPVICKVDQSGGGEGVFLCRTDEQLAGALARTKLAPMLIQEFIVGEPISVEALYVRGKLLHFACSDTQIPMERSPFSPSKARTFIHSSQYSDQFIDEISLIGNILGVTGWLNISCICDHRNGEHVYFEADARPNVWVDKVPFPSDQASERLKSWIAANGTYSFTRSMSTGPSRVVRSFPKRLRWSEICLNRFNSWQSIGSGPGVIRLALSRGITEMRYKIRRFRCPVMKGLEIR